MKKLLSLLILGLSMVLMVSPVVAKGRTGATTANPRAVVLDAGHGGFEPGACYLTLLADGTGARQQYIAVSLKNGVESFLSN